MWIPVKAAVRRGLNNITALQKGNNFSSEKELAKIEFVFPLFAYCLSIIESG